ncbi:hypothetical protein GEMRC1_007010 [Eukaryota sp. GEM-RC1]
MHLLLLVFVLLSLASCQIHYASVVQNNDQLVIVDSLICTDSAVAFAKWNDSISTTGWGFLTVESNSKFDDKDQMRAVGMLEGYLTATRIYQYHNNMWDHTEGFEEGTPRALVDHFSQMHDWQQVMVSRYAKSDVFWYQVGLTHAQLDGLHEGYNKGNPDKPLSFMDLLVQTAEGDLYETLPALNVTTIPSSLDKILEFQSCSALIKISPSKSDIWLSHNTWTYYQAMLRIHKTFNLGLNSKYTKNRKMAFTSKPGYLFSKDDAYILGNGLWVAETTISVADPALYQYISPETVLTWARSMIANRMAETPHQWTEAFKQYNSGTYSNQWMVVDLNGFVPGRGLLPNSFYIIEQLPGSTFTQDVTHILSRQGYWPSYNIPHSKVMYDRAGYPELKKKFGDQFDYDKCPRANIFRRDTATLASYEDFQRLLRQNNWETDAFALGSPKNAIASRYDLDKENPRAFGAIDAKTARFSSPRYLSLDIVSGPTYSNPNMKPFTWSTSGFDGKREGHPDSFNFDWIRTQYLGSICH